uniref:RNA helicase n=1 Tax=Odontella aurita TaxID=265563 RepID=A0A7S4I9X7_9STRA
MPVPATDADGGGRHRPFSSSNFSGAIPPPILELSHHDSLSWARNGATDAHRARHRTEYQVLRTLGRGAFGTTFQVRNRVDSRLYAMKCVRLVVEGGGRGPRGGGCGEGFDSEDCRKVLREVEVLSGLRSDNIVRYYSAWVERAEMSDVVAGGGDGGGSSADGGRANAGGGSAASSSGEWTDESTRPSADDGESSTAAAAAAAAFASSSSAPRLFCGSTRDARRPSSSARGNPRRFGREPPPPPSTFRRYLSTTTTVPLGASTGDADAEGETAKSGGNGNGFFADPSVHPTFASLGIRSPELIERVESYLRRTTSDSDEGEGAEVPRPSAVQSAAFDSVSSGKDVTLGSETGSGKTLAYLLPLIDDVLNRKKESAAASSGEDGRVGYLGYDYARAVILVPNKELVHQVVRMAAELSGGEGRCVVSNAGDPMVDSSSPWGGGGFSSSSSDDNEETEGEGDAADAKDEIPEAEIVRLAVLPGGLTNPKDFRPFRRALNDPTRHPPVDIVVTTPANLGPMALSPKNIDIFADVQTLVIDEADMLLDGGYVRQLNNVLMGFRRADKLVDRNGPSSSSSSSDEDSWGDEDDDGGGDSSGFGQLRRTQHVLVAATLPDVGLRSVDAYIRKRFPFAERVTLDGMHNARHGGLRDRTVWIRDEENIGDKGNKMRMERLVRMLSTYPEEASADDGDGDGDGDDEAAVGLRGEKVMMFLNTKEDVEGAAGALRREGIDCVPYHAKLGLGERSKNLDRFRRYGTAPPSPTATATAASGDGESDDEEDEPTATDDWGVDEWGKPVESPVSILVCTDLASRGLDVPSVSAVVQLQFAGNVVAHLHRMGRCGRAGRVDGRGVVFYGDKEAELVDVVREAEGNQDRMELMQDVDDDDDEGEEEVNEGVEKKNKGKVGNAFSRKRGFTRKRKKLRREAREAAEAAAQEMEMEGGGDYPRRVANEEEY